LALRSIPLMLVLPVAACEARPSWEREGLGRAYFDPSGAFVHAGVSARARPAVVPMAAGAFGADTLGRDFHLFRTRCGACHEAPDPGMKTAEHWSFLIGRMKDKTKTAGLIPMTDAEADSILGSLMRHGRR
jgi:hypothetical protein